MRKDVSITVIAAATVGIFGTISILSTVEIPSAFGALPAACSGDPRFSRDSPTANPHDLGNTGNPHDVGGWGNQHETDICLGC